jgi:hypothetical protein
MGRLSKIGCAAIVVPALLAGCQKHDAEALASIGGKIAERAHAYAAQMHQKCPSLPGSLEGRVRNRLTTDKSLAESVVDVVVSDKNVELKGSLATQEQVRRAVDLAESTVGVENVVNSLRVEAASMLPTP